MEKEIKVKVKIDTYRKKYCNNSCPYLVLPEARCWLDAYCVLFGVYVSYQENGYYMRCPECLKAEKK